MDEQLLIRFLSHNCTPDEIKQVKQWISSGRENAEWIFEMERIWSLKDELYFSDKHEINEAYDHFLAQVSPKQKQKDMLQVVFSCLKYAVAIFVVGILSIYLYKVKEEAIPPAMNIVEVPKGQRTMIILSDGTKVWLNAKSRFTYPANFSAKKRNVQLEGEGFFEVARNENAPFVLSVFDLDVEVLGTMFNVKAYPDEMMEIMLEEGSVEVRLRDNTENPVTMAPNELLLYSKATGMILNKDQKASVTSRWTVGEFFSYEQPLREIAKELERKFNIPVTIRDKELENELFTCHSQPDASLLQIMNLLKETRKVDYIQQEKEIIIYKPVK